jgi:hypothetical protein
VYLPVTGRAHVAVMVWPRKLKVMPAGTPLMLIDMA